MKNNKNKYLVLLSIITLWGGATLFAGKKQSKITPKQQSKTSSDDILMQQIIKQKEDSQKQIDQKAKSVLDTLQKNNCFQEYLKHNAKKKLTGLALFEDFYTWLDQQFNICAKDFEAVSHKVEEYFDQIKTFSEIEPLYSMTAAELSEICNIPLITITDLIPQACSKTLESCDHLKEKEKSFVTKYKNKQTEKLTDLVKLVKHDASLLSELSKNSHKTVALLAQTLIFYEKFDSGCRSLFRDKYTIKNHITECIEKFDVKKENSAMIAEIQHDIRILYKIFYDLNQKMDVPRAGDIETCKISSTMLAMLNIIGDMQTTLGTLQQAYHSITAIQQQQAPNLFKGQKNKKGFSKPTINTNLLDFGSCGPISPGTPKQNFRPVASTEPPFTTASDYIACWISGKNYWDESLKRLKIRYGYNDEYMATQRDQLIKSHVLPLEADDYIEPLAKKEPWLNEDDIQTGWFYTIPGYLEDHKNGIKQRGLFTWGVTFDGACLHRSFSIRKDKELFESMTHNENKKQIYKAAQRPGDKDVKLDKKDYKHNIPTQDAWDVIIPNPETGTTVYLSKCIYKNNKDQGE